MRIYNRNKKQGEASARYEFITSSQDEELERLCLIAQITRAIPDYRTYVEAQIGPVSARLMLDTGNSFYSVISRKMQHALRIPDHELRPLQDDKVGTAKKSTNMTVAGITKKKHKIYIDKDLPPLELQLVVLPELGMPCNISGRDMKEYGITMLPGDHIVYCGKKISMVSRRKQAVDITKRAATTIPLYTTESVTLGPLEEAHVHAVATSQWGSNSTETANLIPSDEILNKYEVKTWSRAAMTLHRKKSKQGAKYLTKVGLFNLRTRPVTVPKGSYYGDAEIMVGLNDPHREQYSLCFISNEGDEPVSCRELGNEGSVCQISQNVEHPEPVKMSESEKEKCYKIPPSPDRQSDPLAGDDVQLPSWMKGETTTDNYSQRYQYLFKLFEVGKNELLQSEEERKRFLTLLLRHWELFAWDGTYGVTTLIEHYIRTPPGCKPINDRYRAPNPALTDSLKAQLAKWIKHDCIEPSDSAWNSNLLAVVKSSDISSVRWVVDYRKLNMATAIDRFPIGDVTDNLSRLGKSRYYSALDNSGAFHCIPIAEEDRHKTSFATPFNTWQFKRLPFGLSGGPSSYSRLVVQVLRNIPPERAVAYVDDVLIHSATFMQHLNNLDEVFNAYTKAGLKLNPKKCKFLQGKIDYLGHTVSAQGIEPQKAYLEVIKDWPVPTTLKDIEVFMGKAGYYRKFIYQFAKIAKPLTDRLRIADANPQKDENGHKIKMSKAERRRRLDTPITLNAEELNSFRTLVNCLCSSPILGHPRFDDLTKEYFILDTDWSQEANTVAGVLSQNQLQPDGTYQEKVIGYASKKLSKAQANYSSPKGEVCGILMMIEHFRYYLMVGHFILRTDNMAARALQDQSCPTGYWARWKARLENFSFTPKHRSGKKHGNADSLSRISHTKNNPDDNPDVFDEKTDRQYLFPIGSHSDSDSDSGYSSIDEEIATSIELDPWTEDEIASIERHLDTIAEWVTDCEPWPFEYYQDEEEDDEDEVVPEVDAIEEDESGTSVHDDYWTPSQIRDMQDEDMDLRLIKKWVRSGSKPETQARAEASSDLKTYINLFESLSIDKHGILRYNYQFDLHDGCGSKERHLIVLPDSALRNALRIIHEAQAHIGSVKLTELALRYMYGPRMRAAAEHICATCLICQAKGKKPKPQDYSLVSPRQGYPFMTLNLDYVGPLPTSSKGNTYMLTAECMLTKWIEAYPVRNANAATVANKLITELFPRFGHCEFLKTDQGTHFKNETLKEICEITGIEHIFSPSYRPQANPVERTHRTLKNMITSLVMQLGESKNGKWEDYLPMALTAYRMSWHSSIQTTPFEALFGFPPSMDLGMMFGPPPERREYPDKTSFAIAHRNRMSETFAWINKNISTSIERRRRFHYNNPKRLFNLGDKVWLLTPRIPPGERKAFRSPYTGPWTITRRINEVVYEISPDPRWSRKKSEVVTVDRLKKYQAPVEDEDDEDATHPPGMNEDLSFPGNEFVERLTTGASNQDNHDNDGADGSPFPDHEIQGQLPVEQGNENGNHADAAEDVSHHEAEEGDQRDNAPQEHVELFPPVPQQHEQGAQNHAVQVAPPPLQPLPVEREHDPMPAAGDHHDHAEDQRGADVPNDLLEQHAAQQPEAEPVAPPQVPAPQPRGRGRPPGRRPRQDWPSTKVRTQPEAAPTRLLPSRADAHKSFRGARVYDPNRRRNPLDDDDVELAEVSNHQQHQHIQSPIFINDEPWDDSEFKPTISSASIPPTATSMKGQPDLSDQTKVLRKRAQIARDRDSRKPGTSKPSSKVVTVTHRTSSQPPSQRGMPARRGRPSMSQPPPAARLPRLRPPPTTLTTRTKQSTLLDVAQIRQEKDKQIADCHKNIQKVLDIDLQKSIQSQSSCPLDETWLYALKETKSPLSNPKPGKKRPVLQFKLTKSQRLREQHNKAKPKS